MASWVHQGSEKFVLGSDRLSIFLNENISMSMDISTHPLENSRWINLKKQDEYRVWKLVDDSDNHTFVIYQLSNNPICLDLLYHVKHREKNLIGAVFWHPVRDGRGGWSQSWSLDWGKIPLLYRGEATKAIAYARPLEMWASKFKPINNESRS